MKNLTEAEHIFDMFFVGEMKNKDVEEFKRTHRTLHQRVIMPAIESVATRREKAVAAMLDEAMRSLDDYLNAGSKEERKAASKKAKKLYEQYYKTEYKNRNER